MKTSFLKKNARQSVLCKRDNVAIAGCFNVFLAVRSHSWRYMNGASWMEAARQHKCAESRDDTRRLARLAVPSLGSPASVSAAVRRASFSQPRVASLGLEVLMLKRLGRGVTRPLHWEKKKTRKKKNKLVHVGAASRCVTPTWILIGRHRKHRKWCRPGSSTSYRQSLTRTRRPAQLVISVPTPPVAARAGLWLAVCSVTLSRRCRACCTGCHR